MKIITLDTLPINYNAKIYSLKCNETLKRRLLDLGLVSETNIMPVFKSPIRKSYCV